VTGIIQYADSMKIGLPRALLYYRYGDFWRRFLTELGAEVVLSRKTDRVLVQDGVTRVPGEVCLPIKIVAGHLAELAGRVDAVFFPRLVWQEDRLYGCPKMIGIVDIARMMYGSAPRLIAPAIKGGLFWPHFRAGLEVNPNPAAVLRAWRRSASLLRRTEVEPSLPEGERRVALIGHFYNIGDDYIADALVRAFVDRGYRIVTKEELPRRVLRSRTGFAGKIRWTYERELYNAFMYLKQRVDGVCVVISMGCGPDSLVAELMREEAERQGLPFLQLVIDEHTGTAGLVTRIEAFVDLSRRRVRAAA